MDSTNQVIYIGNIPINCTHEELVKLFSPFGPITHLKIPNHYFHPETQLDFAFVKLSSLDQMQQAISALDRQEYQGKTLLLKLVDMTQHPPPTDTNQ